MWPSDVRNSLWNYDRTIAGPSGNQLLPLSNYPVDSEFLMYFVIGLVVVWLYAWNRFNRRSYDPSPFDYRVIRELQPAQMRDTLMMQRAFILYALILSIIYASFTFFGGIILKLLTVIPSVGPVDFDASTLQSPQWPLILAFGLAGLTQLIGPLDHLERTLRGHIHRSLGIPIRIKEYTRQLIAHQIQELKSEAAVKDASHDAVYSTGLIEVHVKTLSDSHISRIQPWAREEIAQTYGVEDILAKLILLWRMIDSLYSPAWPRESVREEMRPLLVRQVHEGRTAALYLSDLLSSPPANDVSGENSQGGQNEPHRTRQEQQLITAIESMDRHLYEVAAILAVYAQRDPDYDKLNGQGLKTAINAVFKQESRGPSLPQLVCCSGVLFVIYCFGVTLLNHDMMTDMPINAWSTAITALYETLRTLCIFVFPTLFAIYATGPDTNDGVPSAAGQALRAAMWAAAASLALMAMTAMLYTWMVARTPTDFYTMLMGQPGTTNSPMPFLVWYLAFVPISALISAMVVLARRPPSNGLHILSMALVSILATILALLHPIIVEEKLSSCFRGTNSDNACWMVVVDLVAMKFTDLAAALVAVIFLTQSQRSGRTIPAMATKCGANLGPFPRTAAILCAVVMMGMATPLLAQERTNEFDDNRPMQIVLGFRNDAAPFSFLNTRGENTRYRGYIADLCYEIFAGSPKYSVTARSVTVMDRFQRIRPNESSQGEFIDVLCDPVTIRYDDPDRWKNGIFSPIVFATGVTYLRRHSDAPDQNVELGYVIGTTARSVADDICQDAQARGAYLCQPQQHTTDNQQRPTRDNKPTNQAFSWRGAATRFWGELTARQAPDAKLSISHRQFDSHAEAAEWFCNDLKSIQRFYLGDREVIMAQVAARQERFPDCTKTEAGPLYTYEPYALLITKSDPELVQFVQRRIFQIFSDTSKARSLFAASFPGWQMTSPLANLFLLNGVDEELAIEHSDAYLETPPNPAVRQAPTDPAQ